MFHIRIHFPKRKNQYDTKLGTGNGVTGNLPKLGYYAAETEVTPL